MTAWFMSSRTQKPLSTTDITLVTSALPERVSMLREALFSVQLQRVQPQAHLIGIDHERRGESIIRNRLVGAADTTWVAFLDDDDILFPNHLETLIGAASNDWDFVYTGDSQYNRDFDPDDLKECNYIPVCAPIIRRKKFLAAGGFPEDTKDKEDWLLWKKLVTEGCRFHHIDAITFMTRKGGNKDILPWWGRAQ